jgi:hypothetical protein
MDYVTIYLHNLNILEVIKIKTNLLKTFITLNNPE